MVKCPKCGHVFRARARLGEGTRKKLLTLDTNKINLLEVLGEHVDEPKTVREIQNVLYRKNVPRWRREDKEHATGGWNYHDIQWILSILVYNKLMTMSLDLKEGFDGQQFISEPKAPRYWMTEKQRTYFEEVRKNNGVLF